MSASNYLENELLDHSLGTSAYTAPSAVYVALFTADPGEAGATTNEVSPTGTAYARTLTTFLAAAGGTTQNPNAINFSQATADWGLITHVAVMDAVTGGNVLYYGPLLSSITILTAQLFQIQAGNLTVSLD